MAARLLYEWAGFASLAVHLLWLYLVFHRLRTGAILFVAVPAGSFGGTVGVAVVDSPRRRSALARCWQLGCECPIGLSGAIACEPGHGLL